MLWFFFVWLGRFSRSPARFGRERNELQLRGEQLAGAARSPGVAPLLRGVVSARPPVTR